MNPIRWIWEKVFRKCWHDWHYHDFSNGYHICNQVVREDLRADCYTWHRRNYYSEVRHNWMIAKRVFPKRLRKEIDKEFYQRVCVKCGTCQSTTEKAHKVRSKLFQAAQTAALEKAKKEQIGEQIWQDRCKKNE